MAQMRSYENRCIIEGEGSGGRKKPGGRNILEQKGQQRLKTSSQIWL